ncbi:MAG: hypothetical protein ACYCW6_18535 [Candidatus Xenobia bacterium]
MEAAVGLLLDYPQVERHRMQTMLEALDYTPEVARELCLYVPMAYMRLLLKPAGVRFPEVCIVVDQAGVEREVVLLQQTVFEAAVEYATWHLERGMPRQDLIGLIVRSAEFDAVNDQLLAGTAPTELRLEPALIALDADTAPVDERPLWSGW